MHKNHEFAVRVLALAKLSVMGTILLKNATLIDSGKRVEANVLVKNELIHSILNTSEQPLADEVIDCSGKWLLPGLIDDQVHFREPGLTHKATIYTESRAAVAGGITSFMEMPNTKPAALTQELLAQKYDIASRDSIANYSFFMGTSTENYDEIMKTDLRNVCGLKIFMGSSTGNLLVDDEHVLCRIFKNFEGLIATHCENDHRIAERLALAKAEYGEDIPPHMHAWIRDDEACYQSSSKAVELAKKHGTRLHILHISTAKETELFRNDIPMLEKKITSEACLHHLWFSEEDYARLGNRIKWNPSVKSAEDRAAVRKALLDGRIDVLATDHAPHTLDEKSEKYLSAPSGGPLVQHALPALLEMSKQGVFTPEFVVQKYCHNVADMFKIDRRGYIREGYFADLVLVDPNKSFTATDESSLSKVKWTPFHGTIFSSSVEATWVNGNLVWNGSSILEKTPGHRMTFNR